MPDDLRDLVTADNAVMTQESLGGVPFLFPGGIHPLGAVEMYLLYESVLGFAVFCVHGIDIAEQNLDEACDAVRDWESLRRAVRLTVYYPFPSDTQALTQIADISLGIMTPELKSFLELYLPDPEGWKQFYLGVLDPVLANYIHEETKIPCRCNNFVRELLRGIRLYFNRFVELEESDMVQAELRLGKSYNIAVLADDGDDE
ncbi:unnamed protein product [Urochloa humidicola]